MLGLLLPIGRNTTHEKIKEWLVPMFAIWKSRQTSGLMSHVMMSLLSQIAKAHKDFDFKPYMHFVNKIIYLWVKGNLSEVGNKLSDLIQGTLLANITRFIIHTL